MFRNRSKVLFACAVLASAYVIYLISYFGNAMGNISSSEELGGAIATALVTPHMLMVGLGALFTWLGFLTKKSWAALVGSILYCVAGLIFLLYFIFCIPLIILGFIGYSNQKKLQNVN